MIQFQIRESDHRTKLETRKQETKELCPLEMVLLVDVVELHFHSSSIDGDEWLPLNFGRSISPQGMNPWNSLYRRLDGP
jgi:hypothetical protein